MSNLTPRSLTLTTSTVQGTAPRLVIGAGNGQSRLSLTPPHGSQLDDIYWITVFDRTDLSKPVANEVIPAKNNTTVPAILKQYEGNKQYFFSFLTHQMLSAHVPQGPLYDYLLKAGGSTELRRIEQIYTDIGCGSIVYLSYGLVNVSADDDETGFEMGDTYGTFYLTLQLQPIELNGTPW